MYTRGSNGRSGEAGKRRALEQLRGALLAGQFVAGQRLIEPDLAEMFDVNRSSVRAALIDLAAEGLVERIPNKGARVRAIPVEEAIAINECRMVLDGLCAAKAAVFADDAEIDELRSIGEQLRLAVENGQPNRYTQLNMQLYARVRELSHQDVATRLLERLHEQAVRHQFHLADDSVRAAKWLDDHLALIEAIANHDPDEAQRRAHSHLADVTEALHRLEQPEVALAGTARP
jgi:DNA-binding GntR family transcriptional regulator